MPPNSVRSKWGHVYCFTVVKVRDGLAAHDYNDPGWYRHPQGTVAYEVKEPPGAPSWSEGDFPENPPLTSRTIAVALRLNTQEITDEGHTHPGRAGGPPLSG